MRNFTLTPLTLAIAAVFITPGLSAQQAGSAAAAEDEKIEQIVVTGTRVAGRSVSDTAVPIDIVSAVTLERSGTTELNQALSVALPSVMLPCIIRMR